MWKLLTVILLVSAPQVNAQTSGKADPEQSRILALENAWNQAVHSKDTAALKLLLAPEIVYVDYDGKVMDKNQYLASVQSTTLLPARIASESMNVQLYGAVAVVHGVYLESGVKNGKPYALRERFTDAWVHRNETWVCVASHSTQISQ